MPAAHRKPWPMKWVVAAIVVFVVPYTVINIVWRKPGRAYEPYADGRDRANTSRLLAAGYHRFTLAADRPTEPAKTAPAAAGRAPVSAVPGGLPADLLLALVEPPTLPSSFENIAAAASIAAGEPYVIQFTCVLPDKGRQFAGVQLYRQENRIFIVPTFEPLGAGLVARTRQSTLQVTVPAAALPAARYSLTLVGAAAGQNWSLQVH